MSADNDKGQRLCVANPEEWKMNLATARLTFARPHNKRRRKKLAVFKGMETSHELFLNGQTNALHLHIMNGPYYSKSKCRLWDKAGCWMLIWDQEASDEGISTFLPHSNKTQASQTVQKRWLFASPGTGPKLQSYFFLVTGHLTERIALCVCACWGSWRRDAEQTQAKATTRYRSAAALCNMAETLRCWWRKVASEYVEVCLVSRKRV